MQSIDDALIQARTLIQEYQVHAIGESMLSLTVYSHMPLPVQEYSLRSKLVTDITRTGPSAPSLLRRHHAQVHPSHALLSRGTMASV